MSAIKKKEDIWKIPDTPLPDSVSVKKSVSSQERERANQNQNVDSAGSAGVGMDKESKLAGLKNNWNRQNERKNVGKESKLAGLKNNWNRQNERKNVGKESKLAGLKNKDKKTYLRKGFSQTGQAGHTGQTGQTGHTGQTGQAGHTGQTGQAGHTGQTSQAGHTGQTGQAGHTGQTGQTGHTGLSALGTMESSKTVMVDSPLYVLDQDQRTHVMSAYIVCLLGPDELVGRHWVVSGKESISIGRNRKCDIPIQDLSISKKHLCFHVQTSGIFIEDQNSTNGTFINDQPLKSGQKVQLKDNNKLKLGKLVFKFLDRGNPEIIAIKENFEKAFRDPLTGVGNKFMLDRRAKELFMQSKEKKVSLSLILFDIDHFKKVNDTYGHLAGDFILKEVVNQTQTCFRSSDLFIRCGGEEFCIIMQSSVDRAENAIENARKKLEKYIFKYKDQEIKVTISAGVTCQTMRDRRWKSMYDRADKLLYKAKTAGRNRVHASL